MRFIFLMLFTLFGSSAFAQTPQSLLLIGKPAVAAVNSYTVVAVQSGVYVSGGGTGSSLNGTGTTLAVVGLSYYTSLGANLSDSKGNTWTKLSSYSDANIAVTFYYCINPTTSSSWTFSTTSSYCGVNVMLFKSNLTPTYGSQSGASQNTSGSLQPGLLTPSSTGNVFITVFGSFNGTPAPSIPSGYASAGDYTTATAEAGGCGYVIELSGGQNPTWTSNGTSEAVSLTYFH